MSQNNHDRLSGRDPVFAQVNRGSQRLRRAWSLLVIFALALSLAPLPSSVVRAADLPTLSIGDVTLAEGNDGNVEFVFAVSLSAPSDKPVRVNYDTRDGTAKRADNDYNRARDTLTFGTGQTEKTIAVTVRGDTLAESDEIFTVVLSNARNATIADGEGLGTITNDDGETPPPTEPALAIDDVTVTEGNSGSTTANFTVSLSAAAGTGGVTFDIATADGTATTADNDYAANSLTGQAIPEGSQSYSFSVTVNGDALAEPNETFNVTVSNVVGATVADGQGVGTITNDDGVAPPPAGPTLSIEDVSVDEGDGGTSSATFTVSLAPTTNKRVQVAYATADDSATAGSDYQAASGSLTFRGGETSKTITVLVNGDTTSEPNETFTVTLSNASNATIGDNQGVGTITNDDNQAPVATNDGPYTVDEGGTLNVPAPGLLGNDTDAEGNPLTAVQANGPANGQLTLNADGSFTYVHNGSETTGDSFTYKANDGFGDSSAATVMLTVNPVNDAPAATGQTVSAVEDAATLITLAGTDPENSALSFAIASLPANGTLYRGNSTAPADAITTVPFSLLLSTQVTYKPNANYYGADSFTFTANDGTADSAAATVSLTVSDVNDAPTADATTATTDQNEAVTVTLGGSDLETCDLTFSIVAGPAHGGLGAITNVGCVSGAPNTDSATVLYTPTTGYIGPDSFTYKVTDAGGNPLASAPATASITVEPPNAAPVVTPATFAVAENSANGTIVGTVTFDDADAGQSGTFAITAGNTGSAFAIDATTGEITVAGSAALDFEATPTFNLTVEVTDDGAPPASGSATITVNLTNVNEPATDISLTNSSVAENQPSATTVGTLSATDPEAAQTHTFTLVTGEGDGDNASFTIDGTTLKTAATFDFETKSSYSVRVRAMDNGSPAQFFEKAFTITITDAGEPPTDITLSPSSVAENAASGTTVGTFSTTDADGGLAYTYSLVTGDGDADNTSFTIDGTALKTSAVFDFETKASYSIRVQTDDGSGTFAKQVTITITNVNEAPTDITLTASSVDENQAVGTAVGTFSTTDADVGNTHSYSLVAGEGATDNASFTIDGTTLKTGTVFDFETKSSYSIRVQTDDGTGTFTKQFTITVYNLNDAPVLAGVEDTALAYTENDAATAVSANITVSDADSSTLSGATVTISAGYASGQDLLAFTNQAGITGSFNAATGVLTMSGSASPAAYQTALRAVTYSNSSENPSTAARTISFKVNDGAADSNTVDRQVTVTAVNDLPVNTVPVAQTVNEDTDLVFSTANSNLISITDVDAGNSAVKLSLDVAHGTLTFPSTTGLTFVDSTVNGTASVHVTGTIANITAALNGLIYKGTLHYNSTRGAESLAVVIDDQGNTGGSAESDTDTVGITVSAVNDKPTALAKSFSAQTNMQIAGLGGLLTGATDPDSGDGGYTAALTVGTVGATTPAGGTISNLNAAAGSFDFDPPPGATGDVTFTYTVCDSGNPGPALCSDPATVTASVNGPVIWFVNPAVTGPGDGRLSNPFKTLTAVDAVDAANHRVFVYSGTATGSITLNTSEWLIGQGVTGVASFDALMDITPPAGTMARPSIGTGTATVQGTVTLASSVVVRGLAIASSAAVGLADPAGAITGVSVDQVAVTTSTGTGVNLSDIAGTLSFTGLTTSGGTGANLTGSNGSATFTFTGVSISSGANPGFVATGGGTVQVTGTGNSITSTTGTPLNVTNTTIGPSGLTFRSISANGAPNGIVLNNTGTSGFLTVTGDGSTANSGGTITQSVGSPSDAAIAGKAVYLANASNVTLRFMRLSVTSGNASAIVATNLSGVNALEKSTVDFNNLTPPAVPTANAFGLRVANTNTNATITVDATTFQNKKDGTTAVSYSMMGNSQVTINVKDSNTGDGFVSKYTNLFGSGIVMGAGDDAGSAAKVFFNVSNTQFVNAPSNGLTDLEMAVQQNATLVPNISNNTFDKVAFPLAIVGVINVNTLHSGRLGDNTTSAIFSGNTITNIRSGAGPTFAYDPAGTNGYFGMRLAVENNVPNVNHKIKILNNTFTELARTGLYISTRDKANDVNVLVQGNTIGTLANPVGYANVRGIHLETQATSMLKIQVQNNPSIVTRSSSGSNSSLHLRSGVENNSTGNIQATVVGNTIKNAGAAANDGRFRAQTLGVSDGLSGAAGSICLDLRDNILENAGKQFDLIHNSGGTFNRNASGNTGTVSTTGSIGTIASCTLPSVGP